MFVYDTYEAGKVYGTDTYEITLQVIDGWNACFPGDADGDLAPPGIVVLIQQKAYKAVIAPRPPGHVQGGQQFDIHKLPAVGSIVTTEVSCVSKEIRKERRWVKMGFEGRNEQGELLYTGVNTILVPM